MVKTIDGGVNAAKGYTCASIRAGIKESSTKEDMALLMSEVPATVAGTFTRNLVKAAPVQWDSDIVYRVKQGRAVVINTGIANAVTGAPGLESCKKTAEKLSNLTGIPAEQIFTASTGVIGPQLPMDKILSGTEAMLPKLSDTREAAHAAAIAIMTTDTKPKEIAVEFSLGGKTCRMGAMCKGSGMIHPNMGTMLGFILTDAAVEYELMLKTLREVVEETFNMVSVDGDTSTNDTVLLMANGLAGNELLAEEGADLNEFKEALHTVAEFLATHIAADGEGATRLFTAHVVGAPDVETAKVLAKSVITSNLTKAAIFGRDANWGRIFCAMGYSGANFDPNKTDIRISSAAGEIKLVENGLATDFSEEKALEILSPDAITATCDIKSGSCEATAWGCDLTYDYVTINADYRS